MHVKFQRAPSLRQKQVWQGTALASQVSAKSLDTSRDSLFILKDAIDFTLCQVQTFLYLANTKCKVTFERSYLQ